MTIESTLKIENINKNTWQKNWTAWHYGAIFSFLGGNGAIIIGAILSVEVWLFKTEIWQIPLQTVINGLFYSALPLMYVGAYCLDKIDENKKKYRNENQM